MSMSKYEKRKERERTAPTSYLASEQDVQDMKDILVAPVPTAPPKRELTEKQRSNLQKGMAALKAKREALRSEQEKDSTQPEDDAPPPQQKAPRPQARPKPTPSQPIQEIAQIKPTPPPPVRERKTKKSVSFEDFNNFKNELLSSVKQTERPVVTERVIEKPVERVVEKATVKYLSGSELLDNLFFR